MNKTEHAWRMTQNEAVFRKWNESVHGLDKTKSSGQMKQPNQLAEFLCECSDENCGKKIKVKYQQYHDAHKRRNSFILIKGHEVPEIEVVISSQATYSVVLKKSLPPERPEELKPTTINHN